MFSRAEMVRRISLVLRLSGLLAAGAALAQLIPPASDDVKIQVIQQEMDEDAAGRAPKAYAEAMAKAFQVDTQVVATLHEGKQNWGEIGVRLALAKELAKTDPKSYASVSAALQRIGELRATKTRWSTIAHKLGVDLGQVLTQAQQVRQQMRAEAKKEATAGVVKPGRTQAGEK
jgi:hypothetical protein